MPNRPSSKSDLKRSRIRHERNRGRRSAMRTWIKKTLAAVEAGDKEGAESSLLMAQKQIDKNVKWNQLHERTAARRKSKLARLVNQIQD